MIAVDIALDPRSTFFTAGADHQDYYRANKDRPYCRFVIAPKLNKLGLED